MINILANRYIIDADWCYDAFKHHLKKNQKIVIVPFSFREEDIPSNVEWNICYQKGKGKYYDGIVNSFRRYGVQEDNISWINYFEHSNQQARELIKEADVLYFTGGLPDLLMQRLDEFDLISVIKNFKGVVIGFSAGALIQLEEYHLTSDKDYPEFVYHKGLNMLKGFHLEVHFNGSEDQLKSIKRVIYEKAKPVYAIEDQGALLIENNEIKTVGKVHIFYV